MSGGGSEALLLPLRLRLGAIARWGVTAVFALTLSVAAFTVVTPARNAANPLVFFVPVAVALALGTIAVWRCRLELGTTEIRRRGLLRTRIVLLDQVTRVALSAAPTGGEHAHVFVAGRHWPMSIDLRYWERPVDVRAYLAAVASRLPAVSGAAAARSSAAPGPRPDDRTATRDARRSLTAQRAAVLVALAVALGGLAVPAAVAAVRGRTWGIAALVLLAGIAAVGWWFASATPGRWVDANRTLRSQRIFYAEVVHDIRLRDQPNRHGLRADGRLEVTAAALDWTARAGSARFSIEVGAVDDLLLAPASWRRWALIAHTPIGVSRFYVSDAGAVADALRDCGWTVRTVEG